MIKIKSKTDVITNSSSESYIIKTSLETYDVKRIFYDYLEKTGDYGTELEPIYTGIYDAYFEKVDEDHVLVDYSVLCNIDDCEEILVELFGKENVEFKY